MSHSPGPWWATDYGIRNSGGYICALVQVSKYEGQDARYATEKAEREGDARLIAEATELLEALKALADVYHQGQVIARAEAEGYVAATIERAEVAIKKAEGAE